MTLRSKRVYERKILIFDMKNDLICCAGNLPSTNLSLYSWVSSYGFLKHLEFTIGKDGVVYGFYRYSKNFITLNGFALQQKIKCWTEIRAFHLENDKLVYDGVKFKGFESLNDYNIYDEYFEGLDEYNLKSAFFV